MAVSAMPALSMLPRYMPPRVERHGDLAGRIDRDQPARAAAPADLADHLLGRLGERLMGVMHPGLDLVRHPHADEMLAVAGG